MTRAVIMCLLALCRTIGGETHFFRFAADLSTDFINFLHNTSPIILFGGNWRLEDSSVLDGYIL